MTSIGARRHHSASVSGLAETASARQRSAQEEVLGPIIAYFPVYADIEDKRIELQSERYNIQVNEDALMLPVLLPFCGQTLRALRTCGDGACSLHAVWGWPSPSRELMLPEARARAVGVLGFSITELQLRHAGSRVFNAVLSSLWGELLLPAIAGTGGLL